MLDYRTRLIRNHYMSFSVQPTNTIWYAVSILDPKKLSEITGILRPMKQVRSTMTRVNDDDEYAPAVVREAQTEGMCARLRDVEPHEPQVVSETDDNPIISAKYMLVPSKGFEYESRSDRHNIEWFETFLVLGHLADDFNGRSMKSKEINNGRHLGFLDMNNARCVFG